MAEKVFVVSADEVTETDHISHAFMFAPDVPTEQFIGLSHYYGWVKLENDQWSLRFVQSGKGIIINMVDVLVDNINAAMLGAENCVLLTNNATLPRLLEVLKQAGVTEIGMFEFSGNLSTSQ